MAAVGLLSVELHFAGARSLKDKRRALSSIKDRLRKLNVAVAELDAIASHLYGVPDHLIDVVWDRPTRPDPSDIRRFRGSWT